MDLRRATCVLSALGTAVALGLPAVAVGHPVQHGPDAGHLTGSGEFGALELVGRADLTNEDDIVADVGVDPSGDTAYLAHWGKPT